MDTRHDDIVYTHTHIHTHTHTAHTHIHTHTHTHTHSHISLTCSIGDGGGVVSSLDDVWPMVQCFGKKWIGHSQDDLGTRETRIQHLHMHTHIHTYTHTFMYLLTCIFRTCIPSITPHARQIEPTTSSL